MERGLCFGFLRARMVGAVKALFDFLHDGVVYVRSRRCNSGRSVFSKRFNEGLVQREWSLFHTPPASSAFGGRRSWLLTLMFALGTVAALILDLIVHSSLTCTFV